MIHPTAKVDPQAQLAPDAVVEEFAIIRGKVTVGAGTVIAPYTMICGTTRIGQRCRVGPSAFVGMDPQHRGYAGAETELIVGDDTTKANSYCNVIRGGACAQVFEARDTVLTAVSVWRIPGANVTPLRLYVMQVDSTGTPRRPWTESC